VKSFYLRGWQLGFATHATIRPHPGRTVAGALWRLTPECEKSLDYFEGYPTYYTKRILEQDGQEFMVYLMNNPKSGSTYASYVNQLEQGYEDWNLDKEYLWSALDQTVIPDYNISEPWTQTSETPYIGR
jgi:gamma-glutamylcyclotransferase (GGCT)/AIG2-like uncharacterized protein YtfP